jgi:hypothetical protein
MSAGASRRDATLTVNYSIPLEPADEEAFGKNLSLLLGVYRTTIELNIPDVNSRINFKKTGKPGVSVAAYAAKPAVLPSQKFTERTNNLYFFSFNNVSESFPDFANFRAMSDYLPTLFRNGSVLAARPVCGSLRSALEEMSDSSLSFEFTPDGRKFADLPVRA